MARFKLTAPHCFTTARGPAQFDRGDEVESADYIGFRATIHMVGLDDIAVQQVLDETARLRQIADSAASSSERAELPGCFSRQTWPQ